MTIVSVVSQAFGHYCLESLNPAFSHVWTIVIEAGAVTIAMYCVIQFYLQIRKDIAQHKPLLKVAAIKLVIFLSFWQTIAISLLTSTGLIKTNDHIKTPDIKVGIPSMLLCIEMALFSIFHLWAFTFRPYRLSSKVYMSESVPGEQPQKYQGGFLGIKAIIDSMNPWDMVKAIGRAARWLVKGRRQRHLDVSYNLSRKTSENSNTGIPKPAGFGEQTAYTGPLSRPVHYGGGDPSEGQTLLANQQAMGTSLTRPDSSPYRQPSPYRTGDTRSEFESGGGGGGGDIGVAKSSHDERPHYQAYNGQETGVTAAPYPAKGAPYPAGSAPYPERGRPTEAPYYPPPPATRRDDNMF